MKIPPMVKKLTSVVLGLTLALPEALLAAMPMDMKADRDQSGYMGIQDIAQREAWQEKNVASLNVVQGPVGGYQKNAAASQSVQGEIARIRTQTKSDLASLGNVGNFLSRDNGHHAFKNDKDKNSLKVADAIDPKSLRLIANDDPNALSSLVNLKVRVTDESGRDISGLFDSQLQMESETGITVLPPRSIAEQQADGPSSIAVNTFYIEQSYKRVDSQTGVETSGTTRQTYQQIGGKWRLTSTDHNRLTNFPDGSYERQNVSSKFTYDSKGRLIGAAGGGTSYSNDGYGNAISGTSSQTYQIVNGKLVLSSFNMSTQSQNIDGSARQDQISRKFSYDRNGNKIGDSESWIFITDDGFGNATSGTVKRGFASVNGAERTSYMRTDSTTSNKDGSQVSQSHVVTFQYDSRGTMIGASGSGSATLNDGWGNLTPIATRQTFQSVGGKLRRTSETMETSTVNLDGSLQKRTFVTNYKYDAKGRLVGAAGSGTGQSDDGFGRLKTETYQITYVIVNGSARVSRIAVETSESDLTGSASQTNVTLTFQYNQTGIMIGAAAVGDYTRSDAMGMPERGTLRFTFAVMNGQVRVTSVSTHSQSVTLDGSSAKSATTVSYSYDRLGRLAGMKAQTASQSNDGFGNIINMVSNHSFILIQGQPRLAQVKVSSVYAALDQSASKTESVFNFTFDSRGRMIGAAATGVATHNDGYGNIEYETINMTFMIHTGQLKLASESRMSIVQDVDGSVSQKVMTYQYKYDSRGLLNGMTGQGTLTSNDGFGNVMSQNITRSYVVVLGEPKLTKETLDSSTAYSDGFVERREANTILAYSQSGRMTGMSGTDTFIMTKSVGAATISITGQIDRRYTIINGTAKLSSSRITASTLNNVRLDESLALSYGYDSLGRLTGVTGQGEYSVIGSKQPGAVGRIIARFEIVNGYPRLVGYDSYSLPLPGSKAVGIPAPNPVMQTALPGGTFLGAAMGSSIR